MPRVAALVLVVILVAGGVLAVPAARSASPDVVVGQVYAGGGNAGELRERLRRALQPRLDRDRRQRLDDPVRVGRRHDMAGDDALTGSIAPGRRYLVQLASAGAVGSPLPTPDATGTTNLAVSGGKVAVVRDASPLTCGGSAGSCSAVASLADLIGYGAAVDYEGSGAAPALDSTTAAVRGGAGARTPTRTRPTSRPPSPRHATRRALPPPAVSSRRPWEASRRVRRWTSTSSPSSRSRSSAPASASGMRRPAPHRLRSPSV